MLLNTGHLLLNIVSRTFQECGGAPCVLPQSFVKLPGGLGSLQLLGNLAVLEINTLLFLQPAAWGQLAGMNAGGPLGTHPSYGCQLLLPTKWQSVYFYLMIVIGVVAKKCVPHPEPCCVPGQIHPIAAGKRLESSRKGDAIFFS